MTDLPDGWSTAALAAITSKIGSGATPTGGKTTYKTSGVPLIRSMNVHFSGFTNEGLAYIDEKQWIPKRRIKINLRRRVLEMERKLVNQKRLMIYKVKNVE